MTNPSIKNATLPRNSRVEWIALGQGVGPMIANLTLAELAAALGSTPEALVGARPAPSDGRPLVATLADLPALAEVGSVALLDGLPGMSVGVARIGQESFVAFAKPKGAGALLALSATLDSESGRLMIGGTAGTH
jgi:hypothetical protein